jgi:hypothetical protein
MSFRVEWFDASAIDVLSHGDEFGEFDVEAEAALVFSGDDGAAAEGSIDALQERLLVALAALEAMRHDGGRRTFVALTGDEIDTVTDALTVRAELREDDLKYGLPEDPREAQATIRRTRALARRIGDQS